MTGRGARPFVAARPGPWRSVWRALAVMLALLPGLPLSAQAPLPGAQAPGLQAALADWLADDEGAALPALATLVHEGNTAARLLLARIDTTPALQGPVLSRLDRAGRVALMRAPGGLSGQNWLGLIEGNPLADLWRLTRQVEAPPSVIAGFAALGETRAARFALVALAAREHPGLQDLDPATLDPEMLYLLWRGADPAQRDQIAALVPADHPQRALMGQPADPLALDLWLASSPAAAPLAVLCDARCPAQAVPACRSAAMHALDSHDALLTLGSPVEALVPQATFLASPRGQASTLRRILLAVPMRGRRAMVAQVTQHSACLGEALQAESLRHHQPRSPTPQGG